jgi:hypothetical protein
MVSFSAPLFAAGALHHASVVKSDANFSAGGALRTRNKLFFAKKYSELSVLRVSAEKSLW